MNNKILILAATLIAGAVPLVGHAQTADQRAEPGRQAPLPGQPSLGAGAGQITDPGLVSRVPQTQGGTAPNSAVVPPNLPAGLVPAPGRDPAPQLSTGGGTQLQQPGQTTTR